MKILQIALIVVVALGIPAIVYYFLEKQARAARMVRERIEQTGTGGYDHHAAPKLPDEAERELLPTIGKLMAGANITVKLLDNLSRAGWRLKPSEFVGVTLGAMGIGMIMMTILTRNVWVGLVGGVIGFYIPTMLMKMAMGRRKAALESQISDMVMLVASALRSGYSFLRALQVVAREMPRPISEVCGKILDETQLGVPLEDALTRMTKRVNSYDMDLVASAVIIQSQVGGSLAEVLEAIGETIRERVQIQAEVSSLTAEGRVSGIVLMFLTPGMALALLIINPTYISVLVTDPLGIRMVVLAAVMQLVGFVIIRRMMRVGI